MQYAQLVFLHLRRMSMSSVALQSCPLQQKKKTELNSLLLFESISLQKLRVDPRRHGGS